MIHIRQIKKTEARLDGTGLWIGRAVHHPRDPRLLDCARTHGAGSSVTYNSQPSSLQDPRRAHAWRIAIISACNVTSWRVSRRLNPRATMQPSRTITAPIGVSSSASAFSALPECGPHVLFVRFLQECCSYGMHLAGSDVRGAVHGSSPARTACPYARYKPEQRGRKEA